MDFLLFDNLFFFTFSRSIFSQLSFIEIKLSLCPILRLEFLKGNLKFLPFLIFFEPFIVEVWQCDFSFTFFTLPYKIRLGSMLSSFDSFWFERYLFWCWNWLLKFFKSSFVQIESNCNLFLAWLNWVEILRDLLKSRSLVLGGPFGPIYFSIRDSYEYYTIFLLQSGIHGLGYYLIGSQVCSSSKNQSEMLELNSYFFMWQLSLILFINLYYFSLKTYIWVTCIHLIFLTLF